MDDAPKLTEQAKKVIIMTIQDHNQFVMDYLLELHPVKCLQGTKLFEVHKLVTIILCENTLPVAVANLCQWQLHRLYEVLAVRCLVF